jgi:hypothetical protein
MTISQGGLLVEVIGLLSEGCFSATEWAVELLSPLLHGETLVTIGERLSAATRKRHCRNYEEKYELRNH